MRYKVACPCRAKCAICANGGMRYCVGCKHFFGAN